MILVLKNYEIQREFEKLLGGKGGGQSILSPSNYGPVNIPDIWLLQSLLLHFFLYGQFRNDTITDRELKQISLEFLIREQDCSTTE